MNLTDSFILKCLCGAPILLEDVCAIIPKTLRQIVSVGYERFLQFIQILMMEKPIINKKDELAKLIEPLSDFQYFLLLVNMDKEVNQIAKEAFLFFTGEKVAFSLEPAQIVVGPIEEKHLLTEDLFYDFRRILKRMYFMEQEGEEIIISQEDSPQLRALKMQMKKNRERVAKAKRDKSSGEAINFSDLVASVAAGDCGLNILDIWDITYYAFHDQLKRMGWREQFNINNRAALAGAKLKESQLKHWIKPITSDNK